MKKEEDDKSLPIQHKVCEVPLSMFDDSVLSVPLHVASLTWD